MKHAIITSVLALLVVATPVAAQPVPDNPLDEDSVEVGSDVEVAYQQYDSEQDVFRIVLTNAANDTRQVTVLDHGAYEPNEQSTIKLEPDSQYVHEIDADGRKSIILGIDVENGGHEVIAVKAATEVEEDTMRLALSAVVFSTSLIGVGAAAAVIARRDDE